MNTNPIHQSPSAHPPRERSEFDHLRRFWARASKPAPKPASEPAEDGDIIQIGVGAIIALIALSALAWGFSHAAGAQERAAIAAHASQ